MNLYMCKCCGHAQLLDVVNPIILYGNYIYTSGSSPDLNRHFASYAKQVIGYLNLAPGVKILDVGSNDGLLLSKFKDLGFTVLGVDPSEFVASRASERGIRTEIGFFDLEMVDRLLNSYGYVDLVTANNVFSHADNLREFAKCASAVLSENGAFVFEVSYLKDLVDHLVIDYVYHEHLCHHSVKPLKQFLALCGLKLINIERVKTKGGSIRCYSVKAQNSIVPSPIVERMIDEEIAAGLYSHSTYQALHAKMDEISFDVRQYLGQVLADGGSVAAYGASATSTVLNAIMQIDHLVSFIVDDNSERQHRLSPGSMVPVLGASALVEYRPRCVVLSAWRFAPEIISRNQEYLAAGGVFVVPLPELKVIKQ